MSLEWKKKTTDRFTGDKKAKKALGDRVPRLVDEEAAASNLPLIASMISLSSTAPLKHISAGKPPKQPQKKRIFKRCQEESGAAIETVSFNARYFLP